MPSADNRPTLQTVLDRLGAVPAAVMASFGGPAYAPIQSLLDDAIAYVEDVATTRFNATSVEERYDGNGTNQLTLRKRPILAVSSVKVETPILGYTRVYTPAELQVYRKQGILKVFTYKLAVEQALLQTVDYQAWGSLFPPLPRCVIIDYSYGFPLYDANANQTSEDGTTWQAGDLRDPEETNWLRNLQEAAINLTAANFLGEAAGLAVGLATSVSFDGYSRALNPAAFGAQSQAFRDRADAVLKRRTRMFYMATAG